MKTNIIIIHPKDNVAIALQDIKTGDTIIRDGKVIFTAVSDIPYSHKIALHELEKGSDIIKYGEVIGQSSEKIMPGEWIHTHNLGLIEVNK